MNAIKGIDRNGRIETDQPLDLPEGTELLIPVPASTDEDDGWDNSPESIAAWLKWYSSLEPLIFTENETAAWEADRLARKEWEKANFNVYTDNLARMWK